MKRALLTALILLIGSTAHAAPCQREVVKYATDTVIHVCLKTYDSTNADDNEKVSLKANATFSAGDVKLEMNVAGVWDGEANIGTLPTDRGTCYSQPISAAETTALSGYVTYIDGDSTRVWIDHCVVYYTYGHASAFFPTADVNVISMANNVLTSGAVDASAATEIGAAAAAGAAGNGIQVR